MTVLRMDKMFDNPLQQLLACYRLTVTLLSSLLTANAQCWQTGMKRVNVSAPGCVTAAAGILH